MRARSGGHCYGEPLGEGESELPVFSTPYVGIDRQLLHVEAEPRETKLISYTEIWEQIQDKDQVTSTKQRR